jgi:hypothetical protein
MWNNHLFFSKCYTSKSGLIKRLRKRLDYHNITVSESELRGYSKGELRQLINQYDIHYNYKIYQINNPWYNTTSIY